jgi:hypothetical protein
MSQIHFVERPRNFTRLDAATHLYESAAWADVGEERLQHLVDTRGRAYFHDAQKEPSYWGGVITGFRELPQEEGRRRRCAITFIADEQGRGVYPPSDGPGWRNDWRYVP